jgi:ribonuclease P/MRP protein subunit POP1
MHTEAGVPCFPHDFPDTPAYAAFAASRKEELELWAFKRPPSKRPNFDKLHVPHPHEAPWRELLAVSACPPGVLLV